MAVRIRPAVGFLLFFVAVAAWLTPAPQAQTRASDARSASSGQAKASAKWVVPRTAVHEITDFVELRELFLGARSP